jgi:hypothetical protein
MELTFNNNKLKITDAGSAKVNGVVKDYMDTRALYGAGWTASTLAMLQGEPKAALNPSAVNGGPATLDCSFRQRIGGEPGNLVKLSLASGNTPANAFIALAVSSFAMTLTVKDGSGHEGAKGNRIGVAMESVAGTTEISHAIEVFGKFTLVTLLIGVSGESEVAVADIKNYIEADEDLDALFAVSAESGTWGDTDAIERTMLAGGADKITLVFAESDGEIHADLTYTAASTRLSEIEDFLADNCPTATDIANATTAEEAAALALARLYWFDLEYSTTVVDESGDPTAPDGTHLLTETCSDYPFTGGVGLGLETTDAVESNNGVARPVSALFSVEAMFPIVITGMRVRRIGGSSGKVNVAVFSNIPLDSGNESAYQPENANPKPNFVVSSQSMMQMAAGSGISLLQSVYVAAPKKYVGANNIGEIKLKVDETYYSNARANLAGLMANAGLVDCLSLDPGESRDIDFKVPYILPSAMWWGGSDPVGIVTFASGGDETGALFVEYHGVTLDTNTSSEMNNFVMRMIAPPDLA